MKFVKFVEESDIASLAHVSSVNKKHKRKCPVLS